jgi:RNA polymerase sigma-70 factor (ECF subfamily)
MASHDFTETRRSLLQRLKDLDDQASWVEFLERYGGLIRTVALRSGLSEAEAQDALQETIIAVARNIETYQYEPERCSFKTWLMMITRQRIIWQWRRRLPGGLNASADDPSGTAPLDKVVDPRIPDLDTVWEAEWQQHLLDRAIERVKQQVRPKQYQLFDLCVLQRWPVSDITRTLNVSAAQVYLAKHRVGRLIKSAVASLLKEPTPLPHR